MINAKDYVSRREFEEDLLNGLIKRGRIRELIEAGKLDAVQPGGAGGRWFVRRSEAERLLSKPEAKK